MTSEISILKEYEDFYDVYEGRFFTNGIITFKPTSIRILRNGKMGVYGCGNNGIGNYLVDYDDLKTNFRKVVC